MKELSLHILDIVQNSISAGANLILIKINEDISEDKLSISIDDNGHGMDSNIVEKVKDPFFTSRNTRRVGLGIPLLLAAAKRCDGDLKISSAPGKGTSVEAVFRHSHIDRAPLGNTWDTLAGLIMCNKGVDFVYTHIFNRNIFEFSTIELKKVLKEVSITSPEVIEWVREYLRENIKSLYGGVKFEDNTGAGGNKEEDT